MTALWLAARLAIAGGRLRAALVIAGNAVGCVVLLVAFSLPSTLPRRLSVDEQRLAAVVVVALVVPVVALLATVTRLSSGMRDRRLASLRILGVDARSTRAVAALEAFLLASAGAVTAVVVFVLTRPVLEAVDDRWRHWFSGRPLAPGDWGWIAATVGTLALSLLVALVPTLAPTPVALQVRRGGATARPTAWRLLPVVAGAVLLGIGAMHRHDDRLPIPAGALPAFFLGTVLAGIGLPLATPVGVRLLADVGARVGRTPASLLASRRLQQEPAASARLVAGLLVGLFVVAGARCILVAFDSTPQAVRAEHAMTSGPQFADLGVEPGQSVDRAALLATPGVRAIAHYREGSLACPAGVAPSDIPRCATVVVAECAELPAIRIDVFGCVDGQPAWLVSSHDQPPWASALMAAPPALGDPKALEQSQASASARLPAAVTLPAVTRHLALRSAADDPQWSLSGPLLLLPPDTPGIAPYLDQAHWSAALDGGPQQLAAFVAAAQRQGLSGHAGDNYGDYETAQGYRVLLWFVATVGLGLGLLALVITGIDHALERRRHIAALTTVGVPLGVIRRSQLLQAWVPLAVGLPFAAGLGLLAGMNYLALDGAPRTPALPSVGLVTLGASVAALLVAATTVVGLGRAPRPAELRRE